MGLFSASVTHFPWIQLTNLAQLDEIVALSETQPVLIFKHSTRCSISSFALNTFQREWDKEQNVACYYLDLLQFREISDAIAERFGVVHQSPQVILLQNGKVIHDASHQSIDAEQISSYF